LPLPRRREVGVGQTAFRGLVDSLRSAVERLSWQPAGTQWHDYYSFSNYSTAALEHKQQLVADMLDAVQPRPTSVWDLGANVGLFSRIASERGIPTVSFDIDPGAVETNYLESVAKGETNILPLVIDLTNPSPGLGWESQERMSLPERGPADVVFALALVHHLAIANNVPLSRLSSSFSRFCKWLIIEFVPKTDAQVQKLLSFREDIFAGYTQSSFERTFSACFNMKRQESITDTDRTLYLMEKKSLA
jgi:ribosomal protein L11 methylase PrmA